MTKKTPKRKRGPKEERLVIKDPQKAVDSLFKPKPKKG
jgi:ribosomal protein L35